MILCTVYTVFIICFTILAHHTLILPPFAGMPVDRHLQKSTYTRQTLKPSTFYTGLSNIEKNKMVNFGCKNFQYNICPAITIKTDTYRSLIHSNFKDHNVVIRKSIFTQTLDFWNVNCITLHKNLGFELQCWSFRKFKFCAGYSELSHLVKHCKVVSSCVATFHSLHRHTRNWKINFESRTCSKIIVYLSQCGRCC